MMKNIIVIVIVKLIEQNGEMYLYGCNNSQKYSQNFYIHVWRKHSLP